MTTSLRFSKMHGLGNDFMVIDTISQPVDLGSLDIRKLADRRFGIGFDQLLVVEKSQSPNVDFRYRIFNADGSEVEQCGNGARCFARFIKEEQLSDKNPIRVETQSGVISLEMVDNNQVRVDMGKPVLTPELIPVSAKPDANHQLQLSIEGMDKSLTAFVVSMGNPHAVFQVDEFIDTDVFQIGAALQEHALFPEQVNAGFMQIIDAQHIKLRVFERGVGETMACGTGACAAVVAGVSLGLLEESVHVNLPGGDLLVEWQGPDSAVIMQGDAALVYKGETII